MRLFAPTDKDNLSNRLFFRYFLFYACAVFIGLVSAAKGPLLFTLDTAPIGSFLPTLLTTLAALSTVSNTYLVLLTAFKGLYDVHLLSRVTALVRCGEIGILQWNACFFLNAFSLVLFVLCATSAAKFSFENGKRDLELVFSKLFGRFLLEAFFHVMLSLVLYFLWQHLLLEIPSL